MSLLKKLFGLSILTALTILSSPSVGVERREDKKVLYEIDSVNSNYKDNAVLRPNTNSNNFMNIENLVNQHNVKVDLEKIIEKDRDLRNISVMIKRREDERIFGRYDFIKDIKKSVDIAFRYLPREFFVEISGEKNGSRKLIERSGIIEAPILKMIIVDRDKEVVENEKIRQQQTCYLIEGDEFNHFGYISAWSLVSTGKEHNDQHPGGYTALGYYYVQRKKKFSFNERYNWEMPFALWYEKESGMSEGQNGIHEYHNTPFGREASHGCVREPAEFARANFNWADLKTRVIIIGKRNKNEEDENRFDTNDYPTFRALIDDAMNYRDRIRASDYSSSSFSERQRQDLSKISEIMKKMREQPFSSIEKFSGGERFGKYVKEFVSNKDF